MKDDLFNRLSITIYIVVAYTITWSILFPLSFLYSSLSQPIREIWHSFGSIGPSISALVIIYSLKRRKGLSELKKRVVKYSGYKLLLFAFIPILLLIISLVIEFFMNIFSLNSFIEQNELDNAVSVVIFLLPSLCYGFFEEIGWRGFLLPKLQQKHNAFRATLILTLIWWFWHFPTFFYRFELWFALVFMFPLILTGSFVFTYLFNQSNGSLFMVIVLHISYDIVTAHQISIIATITISIFFVFMTIRTIKVYGAESLSTKPKIQF
jgi:membrane protease YdiL (CAAX protease family)